MTPDRTAFASLMFWRPAAKLALCVCCSGYWQIPAEFKAVSAQTCWMIHHSPQ